MAAKKNKFEGPFLTFTLMSMSMIILGLSAVIYGLKEKEKEPVIFNQTKIVKSQTEIIKPSGLFPIIPKILTTATYRVKIQSLQTNYGIVRGTTEGSGSSFGIDLSDYGLIDKRFLITAAHVVLQQNGMKPVDGVEIQIRTETVKKWIKCKILVIDKDRDVAVLEASEDLPAVLKLGQDIEVGSPIFVSGCPAGTTPTTVAGWLTSKDPEFLLAPIKCKLWQASAPFWMGNSGGPVSDAVTNKVVGMLIAGISTKEGMIPHLAIVIPLEEIKTVLDQHFKIPEK
jgi:S1-C subfamily serine protease